MMFILRRGGCPGFQGLARSRTRCYKSATLHEVPIHSAESVSSRSRTVVGIRRIPYMGTGLGGAVPAAPSYCASSTVPDTSGTIGCRTTPHACRLFLLDSQPLLVSCG